MPWESPVAARSANLDGRPGNAANWRARRDRKKLNTRVEPNRGAQRSLAAAEAPQQRRAIERKKWECYLPRYFPEELRCEQLGELAADYRWTGVPDHRAGAGCAHRI